MSTQAVILRKVSASDLDEFDEAFQSRSGAGDYQWFGFWNSSGSRLALSERQLLGGDANMLAVTIDGTLVGRVEWIRKTWGRADTSVCWEIAIGLFSKWRGRGIGTQAQRQLTDYLFTHFPVHRIQATTDASNLAEQRCLEKIGFTLEGTIRDAQWRDGTWHDQRLYSTLRHEWIITHQS